MVSRIARSAFHSTIWLHPRFHQKATTQRNPQDGCGGGGGSGGGGVAREIKFTQRKTTHRARETRKRDEEVCNIPDAVAIRMGGGEKSEEVFELTFAVCDFPTFPSKNYFTRPSIFTFT